MSDQKKKFLFDLNNFDAPEEEEIIEEEIPPPPMFSEEELAGVRDKAYKHGKKDGYEESRQSLEQQIAHVLEQSRPEMKLFAAHEALREKRYETEVIALVEAIIRKLFPVWSNAHGQEETSAAIEKVLKQVSGKSHVIIEVAASIAEDIGKRSESLRADLAGLQVSVVPNDKLGSADFKMKWADGGAVRDANALAEQILQELMERQGKPQESPLAAAADNLHNDAINAALQPDGTVTDNGA